MKFLSFPSAHSRLYFLSKRTAKLCTFFELTKFLVNFFHFLFQYPFDLTATIALNCGCKGTAIFDTCKLFLYFFRIIFYLLDLMQHTILYYPFKTNNFML